jgi:methyl-accepting chemotaxis protein
MRTYKRRKFFIDRQFQTKYVLLVIFMLLMYTIVFVGTLFIPQLLPLIFNSPHAEQVKAAEILLLYHKHVWPAVFIVIPLFGVFSIFITHKIAGPVYRLKMKLEQMTAWNLDSRLSLRTGDDLQELADCVNVLADELKAFVAEMQNNYETVTALIDAIQEQVEAKTLHESTGRELISRLAVSKKHIADTLERFKLKGHEAA